MAVAGGVAWGEEEEGEEDGGGEDLVGFSMCRMTCSASVITTGVTHVAGCTTPALPSPSSYVYTSLLLSSSVLPLRFRLVGKDLVRSRSEL